LRWTVLLPHKFSARPLIELSIACIFWGFGFIATIWVLQYIGPAAIIFYRFILAFIFGVAVLAFFRRPSQAVLKNEFKLAAAGGFLLSLTLVLQTAGLQFTTATKSAFITTTYVIIVPIFSHFVFKQKVRPLHWLWVLVACIGTLLIVDLQSTRWDWGDSFTILNAFVAAAHILYVGQIAPRSQHPFVYNVLQSLWSAIFCLCLIPVNSRWNLLSLDFRAWMGLLSLALGSTLLGFFLQVRAQKLISPSVASLIFLLESPFSFIFAFWLLHERLTALPLIGAVLILASCLAATFTQSSPPAQSVVVEV
jgi:drug/metabolite transporter (DMT)-like permease